MRRPLDTSLLPARAAALLVIGGCGFVSDSDLEDREAFVPDDSSDTGDHDSDSDSDADTDPDTDTDTDTDTDPDTGYGPVWVQVEAGRDFTCGRDDHDRVSCWGDNGNWQATPPPGAFRSISAGDEFACGLQSDRQLKCWGDTDNLAVSRVPPGATWQEIAAGARHACAVSSIGAIACWGAPDDGALNPASTMPLLHALTAGDQFTCGLTSSGYPECWGRSGAGQTSLPFKLISAIGAGGDTVCGQYEISDDLMCWGGLPARSLEGDHVAVAVGPDHACVVRADGRLYCWGDNDHGQLHAPVGLFSQVTVGLDHSCALRRDGAIVCWGSDAHLQAPPGAGWPPAP